MANTVPVLNFTNTFGDLLAAQNRAANELNTLGANNYIKDSGTLFLNGAGTGLSVTNAGLFGSAVISGILSVGGDISALSSVYINGPGNGLEVANNSLLRGSLVTNQITANTIIRTGTLNVANNAFANNFTSNNHIRTTSLSASGNVVGQTLSSNSSILGTTLNITGFSQTNSLKSNTLIEGSTLVISSSTTTDTLQANTSVNTASVTAGTIGGTNINATSGLSSANLSVSGGTFANTILANTSVTAPNVFVTSKLDANAALISYFNNIQTAGQISVGGNFVINGETVYSANVFTLNSGSIVGQTSTINVNRGLSGANATIRWNDPLKYWEIRDVDNPTSFSKILTANLISNSLTSTSTDTFASSLAANTLNTAIQGNTVSLQNQITSNVNFIQGVNATQNTRLDAVETVNTNQNTAISILQGVDATQNTRLDSIETVNLNQNTTISIIQSVDNTQNTRLNSIETVNSTQNTNITALNSYAVTAFNRANTSSNTFVGTTGTASSNAGVITITSTNGVTVSGSGNTLTINTPQDLRTSASPTFSALSLSNALAVSQGGTGATSAAGALTNLLPSASGVPAGFVLATNGPGTYYWAAGGTGGGGGTTPGTTISSTRSFPTVNSGQTLFTTPTYVPGASQLRVYVNGVRQYNSAYSETSNTSITFVEGRTSGDIVMMEVDGFIINPYYANNIPFTAPFGEINASANTIQLAIQDLETRKAALAGADFAGLARGITVDTNASNTAFATTAFVKNALNQSSNTFNHNISGNAGTVTNGVYTTGNQTIGGTKTFSSTISGSIDGNAGTVTNGVYTTGNQTIGGTKTFSSTIVGSITGSASTSTTQPVTSNDTSIATTAFVRSIVPAGIILMWSGSSATIPSGWLLCDGTNSTPDLRDRFIVGAGSSYAVGATGGSTTTSLSTANLPSHTHSISASGTTSGQSAGHTHTYSGTTSGQSVDHTHSGTTSTAGSHQHITAVGDDLQQSTWGSVGSYTVIGGVSYVTGRGAYTSPNGDHNHTFTTGGVSANHTHTFSGTTSAVSGDHTHTVTVSGTSGSTGSGSAFSILPPYYALCYIMKS